VLVIILKCIDKYIHTSRLGFDQTDLFSYFNCLKETNQLPAFEDLQTLARKLYRAYMSSRAQYRAIYDTEGNSEWSRIVPEGSPWTCPIEDVSSANVGIPAQKVWAVKKKPSVPIQESSANVGIPDIDSKRSQNGQKKGEDPVANVDRVANVEGFKGDCVLAQLGLSKIINIFKYILIISEYYNTIWHGRIHHHSAYH
jgi:hypothetical protein